jgi:hypothetical protein
MEQPKQEENTSKQMCSIHLQVLCPEEGVLVKVAQVLCYLLLDTLHTASQQKHTPYNLLVAGDEVIIGCRAIHHAPASQLAAGLWAATNRVNWDHAQNKSISKEIEEQLQQT